MGGPRSKATQEEISAAFHTEEGFKAVAARLGMSPNTLRENWKAEFGEDAFKVRGKKIQAAAASKQARAMAANRVYRDVEVKCSRCGEGVTLKSNRAAQVDKPTFLCPACKGEEFDRECPVCGQPVSGARGLSGHFRWTRDEAHLQYEWEQEVAKWAGKVEGVDYVTCLECGYRAATLARHLKAAHGITAEGYRAKHGPGVLIRPSKVTAKRFAAAKNRKGGFGRGEVKKISCPSCGAVREVSKFLVPGTHDLRCEGCKLAAEEARWGGKSEFEDYVTCLECGYRAENLTSHIQNAHPDYRERYPDAFVVALGSAVRDKTALRGVTRSLEFRRKIRDAKLLNLTAETFQPFLEEDGTVDHRRMMRALEVSMPTLQRYMEPLGLVLTEKYRRAAAEARTIHIDKETLEQFKLGNGKVALGKAVSALGFAFKTIKRECDRHGLPTFHRRIRQTLCLDAIGEALGGLAYEEEWKSWRFTNPLTGHRFRFDGYFPDVGLIVEFQGHQHYTFPNAYMVDESYRSEWEVLLERDRVKRELIEAAPDLIWFEVREDEPYQNVDYLRGRLKEVLGAAFPLGGAEKPWGWLV